ncbi:MAG: RNA methyltransferase [Candidatus Cloacimonadota bacterium]|nr:RNA methyltransferase [Candidatus Cloacimonadota bacterium]
MKFSQNKFLTFSEEMQQKKLLDFINEIEKKWDNKELRLNLIREFNQCLGFIDSAKYFKKKIYINTTISLRDFLQIVAPFVNQYGSDLRDSDFIILKQDGEKNSTNNKTFPLYLILNNLRSAFNVGSIIRSAECFGIKKIYFCGYTPTPQNDKVKKTAMGTEKYLEWEMYKTAGEIIKKLREENIRIYAAETVQNAISIYQTNFQSPCVLVLGNEALGISKKILELCDEIVQIPMSGWKNSLNVGVTAGICISEIKRQWMKSRKNKKR